LFTGPLFFIYKLLTTIHVAETTAIQLKRPVVPIYWLASEDHDIDEIRSIQVYGKTIRWNEIGGGAVGRLKTDSLQTVLDELAAALGTSPEAQQLTERLRDVYAPGQSLAEATRRMVHELFGHRILILDPDNRELKRSFSSSVADDLLNGTAQKYIQSAIERLAAAGYEIQVNPREINSFLLHENARERIEKRDGQFILVNSGKSFTQDQILTLLKEQPEQFSPNVVLRPLYQQVVLPNIAYVGGPGELAYWLEYRAYFMQMGVHFPVLQPRLFATIVDKTSLTKMAKLGVNTEDLFEDTDQLLRNYVQRQAGNAINFSAEQDELKRVFSKIATKVASIDPTLKASADGLAQQQRNALAGLETKLLRAIKQKEETSIEQLRKLREKIIPGNLLQERVENILPICLRYGEKWLEELERQIKLPIQNMVVMLEKE
jgi:bacillithiol biosynthesis cysteine-adding enzyme BshC